MNLFRSGAPFWFADSQGTYAEPKRQKKQSSPVMTMPSGLRFAGDKKERKKIEQAAEQALRQAGITSETLRKEWGVTLWTLRYKDDGLVLKVDTSRNPRIDFKALTQYFQNALQSFGPITLKDKKLKDCCGKGCKGCLAGDPDKRREWVR